MRPEEIESIRRSLACTSTLGGASAQALLGEVIRLRGVLDEVYETVSQALTENKRT